MYIAIFHIIPIISLSIDDDSPTASDQEVEKLEQGMGRFQSRGSSSEEGFGSSCSGRVVLQG